MVKTIEQLLTVAHSISPAGVHQNTKYKIGGLFADTIDTLAALIPKVEDVSDMFTINANIPQDSDPTHFWKLVAKKIDNIVSVVIEFSNWRKVIVEDSSESTLLKFDINPNIGSKMATTTESFEKGYCISTESLLYKDIYCYINDTTLDMQLSGASYTNVLFNGRIDFRFILTDSEAIGSV